MSGVSTGAARASGAPLGAPTISVVLPVLNGEATLSEQLDALARQTYGGPWELVLADNGSTDGSVRIATAWKGRLPRLTIVDASARRGRAAACNAGATAAEGAALAFCDADDVARQDWLAACVAASAEHAFVAGALDYFTLNPGAPPWKRTALSQPQAVPGGSRFADGANMIVSKTAFRAVGGYCEDMRHSADIDLSWRLEAAGYELHFESSAVMAKRVRSAYRDVWRQSAAWGAAEIKLRQRHGQVAHPPMAKAVTAFAFDLFRPDRPARNARVLLALLHPRYRRSWVAAAARVWGQLRASILIRVAGAENLKSMARAHGR